MRYCVNVELLYKTLHKLQILILFMKVDARFSKEFAVKIKLGNL